MRRAVVVAWLAVAPLAACGAAAGAPASPAISASARAAPPGLHVEGGHLVGSSGAPLRLLGVNRSGTEFSCVHGTGIFDGPSDTASIAAMAAWHINTVRVPLNEDCWLGINGVAAIYGGNAYRAAVQGYVSRLHAAGLVVVLDLHWSAPGSTLATTQMPMPDADHAPAFWTSVASAFASDHELVFDLFNEPFPDAAGVTDAEPWTCWRDGCDMHPGHGAAGTWHAAGMQALVNAVRAAGATQPVMLGGLRWANDLSGWMSYRPSDPVNALVASFHLYNFNACVDPSCWDSQVAPVAAAVPVVTGELGESDCAGGFIGRYMPWADSHGVSYLGWTWNTWNCSNGPALITAYSGSATAFGAALRDHLAAQRAPAA